MIELTKISKEFGSNKALDQLDLSVPEGEVFGLLGRNGAGKSTAIGIMLGQVWPGAGTVRICGHDVLADRQAALQNVGAIFESPAFYDYLSGYRNLQVLSSYTAPTPKSRILEVIEWVGLSGKEGAKVRTYSHGMRARLALAQALLPNPRLLILDEPSDGLDPEGIYEMRLTIQRLRRELGLTILLSSHLLNEVEQLCTRIAVLNKGRKVFEGTLDEARGAGEWVRLKTNQFESAAQALIKAGLIQSTRAGDLISLTPGRQTHEIVTCLVEHNFPVHEIKRERDSVESFYLSLLGQTSDESQE
jgi:ABC-2 type transport system ATP-binding protein